MPRFTPNPIQPQDPFAWLRVLQERYNTQGAHFATPTAPNALNTPTAPRVPAQPQAPGNRLFSPVTSAPRAPVPPGSGGDDFGTPKLPPVPRGVPPPPGYGNGSLQAGLGAPRPPTTPTQPQTAPQPKPGAQYYPKPKWWITQQSAYRPITFPGIESSGNGRTTYSDGSHVDYASAAWKAATGMSFSDPEQSNLWKAIPDSWKAEMATWDKAFVDAYLNAMTMFNQGGNFGGKYMSGAEAAAEIVKAAREAKAKQDAANKAKGAPARPADNQQRFTPYIA